MCKGLFSWENTGKKVNLWNFDAGRPILTGKGHDIPNQYIPIKHWITGMNCPYLCFWFTLCKGLLSWGKTGKRGNLWNFDAKAKSWKAKHTILPHHYMKIKPWRTRINFLYLWFPFTMCKGLFSWEKAEKKGDLWHIHAWSQILTRKTRDTTTPIYDNQTLSHRH